MVWIVLSIIFIASLYLLSGTNTSFSSDEKAVLATLQTEEQKALADFMVGKEDVISEYERLKSRVTNMGTIAKKVPIQIASNASATPVQTPAAAGVQPAVIQTPAPVTASIETVPPVQVVAPIVPTAAQPDTNPVSPVQ